MILLETFNQDDWLTIAKESDAYGYAIITPTEEWVPKRESFEEPVEEICQTEITEEGVMQKVISTPEGEITISFKPNKKEEQVVDRTTPQKFGKGYLSVDQADLILNHLPMEITFVNKDEIFQYYNDHCP